MRKQSLHTQTWSPKKQRFKQAGFNLIEIAFSLVVLGVIAMAATYFWRTQLEHKRQFQEQDQLQLADQSVQGFIYAKMRLPCPDVDGDGLEDCQVKEQLGSLPWKSLGLSDFRLSSVRYGAHRRSNPQGKFDTDLSVIKDRNQVLLGIGTPLIGEEAYLGVSNLFDFCHALKEIHTQAFSPFSLQASDGTTKLNIAYALALPGSRDADGDGDMFDGFQEKQTQDQPVFDWDGGVRSQQNDDRVQVKTVAQLYGSLSCANAVGAVGHSHFNVALSAIMLNQAMHDYQRQLELNDLAAGAGVASAVAGTLSAAAGLASAISEMTLAVAETIQSAGALAPVIVLSAVSLVANTAAVVSSIAALAAATALKINTDMRVTEFKVNIDEVECISGRAANQTRCQVLLYGTSIEANAKKSDAEGF
ncbi:MAG: type II secretion system GspH family protein, partial [Burkholderiaceae bacterium]|nr:type II secretion system GspH family protein [Burkholderiaceae bacterium]